MLFINNSLLFWSPIRFWVTICDIFSLYKSDKMSLHGKQVIHNARHLFPSKWDTGIDIKIEIIAWCRNSIGRELSLLLSLSCIPRNHHCKRMRYRLRGARQRDKDLGSFEDWHNSLPLFLFVPILPRTSVADLASRYQENLHPSIDLISFRNTFCRFCISLLSSWQLIALCRVF